MANTETRQPLRILHLTDNYPPSSGGLERSVQSLARVQVLSGHSVAVATTEQVGQPSHYVEDGVEIFRLPFALHFVPNAFVDDSHVFFSPLPDIIFEKALVRAMELCPPDVVHVHGWILYSALRPARTFGAAVVSTAHDYGSVCALKTLYRKGERCSGPSMLKCAACAHSSYGMKGVPIALGLQIASYRHHKVDQWTAISTAVAKAGSAPRHRDRRPMTVIPSYVPDSVVEVDHSAPRPVFVPPNGPYIFFAGAFGSHKGVDVLLEAHQELWSDGVEVPLVLAGVPSPSEPFDFNLPGVVVAEMVPHHDVMAAWVNAAVGVVPSTWDEPFGQVAIECLAAGTPLVVTRVGALPDIVGPNEYGLIVEPSNPEMLAEAIAQLLSNNELSAALSRIGPKRAKQFTANVVQHQIEAAYRNAIEVQQ